MTDILFEYDHILIRSEYKTPDLHRHLASHVVVSLAGDLHGEASGNAFRANGVCIASDVLHTVCAPDGELLLYLFDTSSSASKILSRDYLNGTDFCVLENAIVEKIRAVWNTEKTHSLAAADVQIRSVLGLNPLHEEKSDLRIERVLSFLKSLDEIPEDIMPRLSSIACLSQSRLSHLFTQQVGISLHRYLAMEKMRKGYIHFQKSGNISQAALDAGFDSPSHFAATCKRMFGISFSDFTKSMEHPSRQNSI